MTLQEIIKLGVETVCLRSYGYTEVSIFMGGSCREIKFEVDEDGFLYNPTFWCEEDPSLDDEFNLIDGRYVSVYDLCSKP